MEKSSMKKPHVCGICFITAFILCMVMAGFSASVKNAQARGYKGDDIDLNLLSVYRFDQVQNQTGFTSCADVTEIPLAECEALVSLYNNTDGDHWLDNTGWLSDSNPCNWNGISCSSGHVESIWLVDNNLYGNIPSDLDSFSNLYLLALSGNLLSGAIPSGLGILANLEYLWLNENQLTGQIPPELGNLSNLKYFSLGGNDLTGNIPVELGSLTNLRELALYNNEFSGGIPSALGNLTNLTQLLLFTSQLSGEIPPELGLLTNLEELSLHSNQLTGSIPSELGNLNNLTNLRLDLNQLSGNIPTEIGNLLNLETLLINGNQLTGAIPLSFIDLLNLNHFEFYDTDLCEPSDSSFQTWLSGVDFVVSTEVVCDSDPSILVNISNNRIEGMNWPIGVDVAITVDDDQDPGNGVLYEAVETTYYNDGIPWAEGFLSHNPDGYTIQAGDYVTQSYDATTILHQVIDLQVTDINLIDDTVSGTAPAGLTVSSNVWKPLEARRDELSDGTWSSDFSDPGEEPHEQDVIDLETGSEGYVLVSDSDDGTTEASWIIRPINDDLVDALEISSLPYTNSQSTWKATWEMGEYECLCGWHNSASVWYSFTPDTSGLYQIDTFGSEYDTVVDVHENQFGLLVGKSCNDDYQDLQSKVVFYGNAGQNYLVRILEYGPDGDGGNLTFHLDSYTCPTDAICATVEDSEGFGLLNPEINVFTPGGDHVNTGWSSIAGYVEVGGLSTGSYDVDITGIQTFMTETGWGLGYHHISAEALSATEISAFDISNNPTLNGAVYLYNGRVSDYVGMVNGDENLLVYATPGNYDTHLIDFVDKDYSLLLEDQLVDAGGGSIVLDASVMPIDEITFYWDGTNQGNFSVPGFNDWKYTLGEVADGHLVYISHPDSNYSMDTGLVIFDGDDEWYYDFHDSYQVTGSPEQVISITTGGTLSTVLSALNPPYFEGGVGSLEAVIQDAYGHTLSWISHYDHDGSSFTDEKEQRIDDPISIRTKNDHEDPQRLSSGDSNQSQWHSILPEYLVEDALGVIVPGSLTSSLFNAPYQFDVPDPANIGTWYGEVIVDFGPYQADGFDFVNFEVKQKAPVADFDGDGDTDISVFRPSNGNWYVKGMSPVSWALAGDLPEPGDYDGDGTTDIAVYRPSNGNWYVRGQGMTSWGFPGDIPLQSDYDGDGADEIAVLRPSNGKWYIQGMGNFSWHLTGDIPVPCDYDGDGADEIAVFRPSNNNWYVKGMSPVSWALSGDIPVPADYDGDGTCDIAVYRPSLGNWYVKGQGKTSWGFPDDIPVPGDYDGDGADEIAVLRPSNGKWYIQGMGNFFWYLSGDYPLPARDTNADGDVYE